MGRASRVHPWLRTTTAPSYIRYHPRVLPCHYTKTSHSVLPYLPSPIFPFCFPYVEPNGFFAYQPSFVEACIVNLSGTHYYGPLALALRRIVQVKATRKDGNKKKPWSCLVFLQRMTMPVMLPDSNPPCNSKFPNAIQSFQKVQDRLLDTSQTRQHFAHALYAIPEQSLSTPARSSIA